MKMNLVGKLTFVFMVMTCLTVGDARPEFNLKKFLKNIVDSTFDGNSIGAIGEINTCSDYGSWCKQYARYCSYEPSVQQYCKVTCNLCPKPTTTTTTTTAPSTNCKDIHPQCDIAYDRGYCTGRESDISFMRQNCPKTCKFCSIATEKPACEAVDINPSCISITQYCSSTKFASYMKNNCAKTCGFCKTETKCGVAKRRSQGVNKGIISGVEATKGFYPWQVAIYYDDDFLCGGSLISNKHVLTAAHCFKYLSTDMERYEIVLGDHDRSKNEGTEVNMKVKSISQHDDYKYESDTHDVAIMELESEIVFTDDVSPICLPTANKVLKPGSKCYLTGWGKTRFDGSSVDRLMEVELPIAEREHCKERNSFNGHVVNDRMICAGYNNGFKFSSGCHGDSGGPLACEQPDKSWVLYGVVSWGSSQCNGLDRYTVFSRVSVYTDWISKYQNV